MARHRARMPHMCLARSLPLRVGISTMWVGVIRWPFDVSWLSGFIVRESKNYISGQHTSRKVERHTCPTVD